MRRLTENSTIAEGTLNKTENGYIGEAAVRLSLYEDMHEALCNKQNELSEKLSLLRAEGKKNTVKFRELMGEKLINTSIMSIYKAYGLY